MYSLFKITNIDPWFYGKFPGEYNKKEWWLWLFQRMNYCDISIPIPFLNVPILFSFCKKHHKKNKLLISKYLQQLLLYKHCSKVNNKTFKKIRISP